jgi:hypothetical protein
MTVFLKCEPLLGIKIYRVTMASSIGIKPTDDHHLLLIVRRPKWNHDNPPQALFVLR